MSLIILQSRRSLGPQEPPFIRGKTTHTLSSNSFEGGVEEGLVCSLAAMLVSGDQCVTVSLRVVGPASLTADLRMWHKMKTSGQRLTPDVVLDSSK